MIKDGSETLFNIFPYAGLLRLQVDERDGADIARSILGGVYFGTGFEIRDTGHFLLRTLYIVAGRWLADQ